jgi:hypothetical protein
MALTTDRGTTIQSLFPYIYIYIYKETNSPIHIANSSPHDQLQHPSNINKSKIKINKCIKKNKTMTLMTK